MNVGVTFLLPLLGCAVIEITTAQEGDPVVTFPHGGSLQGLRTTFNNKPVDLFLGVRYGLAPAGRLRFKKPVAAPPWEGNVTAQSVGNMCSQNDFVGRFVGDEDCLFLDISVPGGTQADAKKPVMVWIHGGGYNSGFGSSYLGAPLATSGDVIIVSINYRLGILGFLSDGPGTGNFALWDQRMALLWVKNNIEIFGGDPDLITIFGESAGGGSVAAQTLHPQNENLFKRAIQQSGTLLTSWGWYLSRNRRKWIVDTIRERVNCTNTNLVYECFQSLSTKAVLSVIKAGDIVGNPWHPTPDGDFFPANFEENPDYELSRRFDLLSGMNGQESLAWVFHELGAFATKRNQTINNGVTLSLVRDYLKGLCSQLTPWSVNLCVEFAVNRYGMKLARSNRALAIKLTLFYGEVTFDAPTVRHLREHSMSNRSTYAYYFTERYTTTKPNPFRAFPDWLAVSASHGDEIPFLFGAAFLEKENSSIWHEILAVDPFIRLQINSTLDESYIPFSEEMMKMWTNFAKSGNPNFPALPERRIPHQEFDLETERFLDMSRYPQEISTPNAERLSDLEQHLFTARTLQVNKDKPR